MFHLFLVRRDQNQAARAAKCFYFLNFDEYQSIQWIRGSGWSPGQCADVTEVLIQLCQGNNNFLIVQEFSCNQVSGVNTLICSCALNKCFHNAGNICYELCRAAEDHSLLTKVFLEKPGRNIALCFEVWDILQGQLRMERENENQALVTAVWLGTEPLLCFRDKPCTFLQWNLFFWIQFQFAWADNARCSQLCSLLIASQ